MSWYWNQASEVGKIHQLYTLAFLRRTYEGEDSLREECESLSLSYYTYPHLRALFTFGER
ncbi:MAG TPA: hypothetical protein VF749_10215 [Candidatus Acidoferrum sp.]